MDANKNILDQINSEKDQILLEIAFFKGDIAFLKHVIDRYFVSMTCIENLERLKACVSQFQRLENCHTSLLQHLKQHLSRIVLASKQKSAVSVNALFKIHLMLFSELRLFTSEYLLLRTEILRITNDHIVEDQELQRSMFSGHLLSPN